MNTNLKKLIKETNYARSEIKDDESKGAYNRWLNKKVEKEIILFNPNNESIKNVTLPSFGKLSICDNFSKDSKQSLLLETNNDIENKKVRPNSSISIKLDDINLDEYNRIKILVYLDAIGQQNMYFHFFIGNDDVTEIHTASVYANRWNEIIWEINDIKKDDCKKINITPFLFGTPPEGVSDVKIYIDNIYAQKVKAEHELGWNIEDKISYCHSGYYKNSEKIAITQNTNEKEFKLYSSDNKLVYSAKVNKEETNLGTFEVLDFSNVKKSGEYYLTIGNLKTELFLINNNPYQESIVKSLNFLRLLRCGVEVEGVHSACHLNCRTFDKEGRSVPNFGGWHDAGDLSQFEIPTAEMTNALADLAHTSKDKEERKRILEEIKVGASWLLRTTFHNGERALAITYRMWRGNLLLPDNETVYANVSENGCFENFLSAAALAATAREFKDEDKIFSDWCLRTAIEDYDFAVDGYINNKYTKRWGPTIDSITCGHGIIASVELYKLTSDMRYINQAKEYSKIVMACQQQDYPNWEKPIRGFFYEDVKHTYLVSYEHRGHEQSAIQGICDLYELIPNDELASEWLNSIKLYREYITSTMYATAPYGLTIGQIYDLDKMNPDRFTLFTVGNDNEKGLAILRKEAMNGIRLDERVYLRRFPVAIQRRGFHATLLSKTKGISACARVLKDKELMQIAINQLEWVLGKNPFSQSTMYGEGNDYHPLYVAYSREMVGALPVGIMTKGDLDAPYWPTRNNAVYKEIWGHTTGKYLWVLSDIRKMF